MRAFTGIVSAAALLATPADAAACPVCDSETGVAVRAAIFDDRFVATLGEVVAPFAVLALLLVVIERRLLRPAGGSSR